jgi:hypothetical protein
VASGVTAMSSKPDKPPDEPSSPSCFAHEADDVYMGFASQEEIAALVKEIRGTAFEQAPARDRLARRLRLMLPKVRNEQLYPRLSALLQTLEAGNVPADELLKAIG